MVKIIVLQLALLLSLNFLNGQDLVKPEPPSITYITVLTPSENIEINWLASTSADVEFYIIYKKRSGSGFAIYDAIDTVAGSINQFIYNVASYDAALTFFVGAIDTSKNKSIIPQNHTSVILESNYDACNRTFNFSWNPYEGFSTLSYKLFESNDGILFQEVQQNISNTSTSKIIPIQSGNYCYYIQTVGPSYTSNSNIVCTPVVQPLLPQFIYPKEINASKEGDRILYQIDPLSNISNLSVVWGIDNASFKDTIPVGTIQANRSFEIQNKKAQFFPNYYKVIGLNECNNTIYESSIISTLGLNLSKSQESVHLDWSQISWFGGEINNYSLTRFDENGSLLLSSSLGQDYTEDYDELRKLEIFGKVCYGLVAEEMNNPNNINSIVTTQQVCIDLSTAFEVPDLFTPNGDGINDAVKPRLFLNPSEYQFIIFDKWNRKVFETKDKDKAWDGNTSLGKANEGIYAYIIKLSTTGGKKIEGAGLIQLAYP